MALLDYDYRFLLWRSLMWCTTRSAPSFQFSFKKRTLRTALLLPLLCEEEEQVMSLKSYLPSLASQPVRKLPTFAPSLGLTGAPSCAKAFDLTTEAPLSYSAKNEEWPEHSVYMNTCQTYSAPKVGPWAPNVLWSTSSLSAMATEGSSVHNGWVFVLHDLSIKMHKNSPLLLLESRNVFGLEMLISGLSSETLCLVWSSSVDRRLVPLVTEQCHWMVTFSKISPPRRDSCPKREKSKGAS